MVSDSPVDICYRNCPVVGSVRTLQLYSSVGMTWLALLTPQLEFPGSTPDSSFVLYKVLDVLLELSIVYTVVAW